jgi:hypothetical protein
VSVAYTFDTTVGGASATSYISISDADNYIASRVESNTWSEITEAEKENYLMQATADIDTLHFLGSKYNSVAEEESGHQRLKFPRSTQASSYIPERVKIAVCAQALYILSHQGKYDSRQQLVNQGVENYSIAGVSESLKSKPYSRVCPEVRSLLTHWVSRAIDL